MRAKYHSFLADLPQFIETKDLKAARIGQDGPRPRHETVQPAQLSYLLNSRSKIQVISVTEQDFDAELFQNVLRDPLDRGQGPDRHENRGVHFTVRCGQAPGSSRA